MTKNHTHIYWDRSSDYVPLHQKDCQLSQFQCQQQSKSLLATWQLIIFGGFCKPNFQFTCNCCASTQQHRSITCALTSFFFELSHVIYLKLTRVIQECLLSLNEMNDVFVIILQKKLFSTWKFGKIDVLINFNFFPQFSQFFLWEVNLRGLRAFILQNVQGSVVETEKKVLLPITQLGKEETLIILLSAWDRSRDSTQKRNLSKHMWRT